MSYKKAVEEYEAQKKEMLQILSDYFWSRTALVLAISTIMSAIVYVLQ